MAAALDLRALKKSLRAEARRRRSSLPQGLHELLSALATSRMLDCAHYSQADSVMAFAAFADELDTFPLLRQIIADGKSLVLPRVVVGQRDLELRVVTDLDLLRPGKWGILEPPSNAPTVGPRDLDLVVTPGLAFDERGFRVGYGGGYYDRLIRRMRERRRGQARGIACGLGFEVQVWPQVPVGRRDESLDCLVTDTCLRRFGGA